MKCHLNAAQDDKKKVKCFDFELFGTKIVFVFKSRFSASDADNINSFLYEIRL